ncbi:hypothetical protein BC833DRAFT_652931 [Globomyces pollinis-pini]|nr:hypothetical protein BC833DRAFT_652931 [Globomyces pollinis-pini]
MKFAIVTLFTLMTALPLQNTDSTNQLAQAPSDAGNQDNGTVNATDINTLKQQADAAAQEADRLAAIEETNPTLENQAATDAADAKVDQLDDQLDQAEAAAGAPSGSAANANGGGIAARSLRFKRSPQSDAQEAAADGKTDALDDQTAAADDRGDPAKADALERLGDQSERDADRIADANDDING